MLLFSNKTMIKINLLEIAKISGLKVETLKTDLLNIISRSSVYLEAIFIDAFIYEIHTKEQKHNYHDLLYHLPYIPGDIPIALIEHLLSNGATAKIRIEGIIIEIQKLAEYNENLPALSTEMLIFLIKNGLNHENIADELYAHLVEDEVDEIEQIFISLKKVDSNFLSIIEPFLSKAVQEFAMEIDGINENFISYEILQYLTSNKTLSHKLLLELNIFFDYIDLTKSLVEAGVDVNAKVHNKKLTYLDLALRCCSYETIKYLSTKIKGSIDPVSYFLCIVANEHSKAVNIIKMLPALNQEHVITSYVLEATKEDLILEKVKIITDYYQFIQDYACAIDHPDNNLLSKEEITLLSIDNKDTDLSKCNEKNLINKYAYDVAEIALIGGRYEAVVNHIKNGYNIKATNKFGLSFLKLLTVLEQFMYGDINQIPELLELVIEKMDIMGLDQANWDEHVFN